MATQRKSCSALAAILLALGVLAPRAITPARAGESPTQKPESKLPPLQLQLDLADVDLEAGQLTLRMSRPAARVTLKALSLSGAVLAEAEQRFEGTPAGTPLVVRWTPPQAEAVARIELYGYDVHDYFKGVAITPWSFEIPH